MEMIQTEIGFELSSQPPYSPEMATYSISVANLKRWLNGEQFYLSVELIAKIKDYFGEHPLQKRVSDMKVIKSLDFAVST